MLKTQKLINDIGWDAAVKYLTEELHLQVKEYDDFGVFNYNQIFSPEDNEYVMECRSLQLAKDGTVISRAYPRFFNFGQRPEITGKFEFHGCKIYEKADGSLIRVYWNPFGNRWEIATRGTAFAESSQDFYPTFREAVLHDGFGLSEDEFQDRFNDELMNREFTFVFEYCSMKNRIVTPYPESQMVFIVAIHNATGEEFVLDDEGAMRMNYISEKIRNIRSHEFKNIEETIEGANNLPDLAEGFVLQDVNGLRVKLKSTLYLKLHKMRGDLGFTPKKIASIVADGEVGEVLTYFPELGNMFDKYQAAFDRLKLNVLLTWNSTQRAETQKDFALLVKDLPYSAIMFSLRKGLTFEEIWSNMREESKVDLIMAGVSDEQNV